MTKRFENAISALVEAFFNGTLGKSSCTACAVGNIVAKAHNVKIYIQEDQYDPFKCVIDISIWNKLFMTAHGEQEICSDEFNDPNAMELISHTGYSKLELAKVEKAFESNTDIEFDVYRNRTKDEIMQDQYDGLMAVVDVLCEIEGYDTKEYKLLFEYEPILTN